MIKLNFSSVEELKEKCDKLGIQFKLNDDYGLINLTYSQIETPKFDEFGKKCRGLVVDKDLNILCHPFIRFFNYGEDEKSQPTSLENKQFSFYEKVDGSLIKVYFYDKEKKWLLGTKGQAVANSFISEKNNISFKDLVLKSLNLKSDEEFQLFINNEELNKDLTYLFEITSGLNSPVVPHLEPKLWFLASLNKNGVVVELPHNKKFKSNLILYPKKYDFNNVEKAFKEAQNLPFNDEGYVVYVNEQPSFKIKSPAYVAVHLLKSKHNSENRIIDLVLMREEAEYLAYFPQDKLKVEPYSQALLLLEKDFLNLIEKIRTIKDRKEFSLKIQSDPELLFLQKFLFALKNKNEKREIDLDKKEDLTHFFYDFLNGLSEKTKLNLIIQTMEKYKLKRFFNLLEPSFDKLNE